MLRSLLPQAPRGTAIGAAIGAASTLSYRLILWVWAHAPIALGAALRDTSASFAALIAVVVLRERFSQQAAMAVLLATMGAVLIRLG